MEVRAFHRWIVVLYLHFVGIHCITAHEVLVDAILFRTHVLDDITMQKVMELVKDSTLDHTTRMMTQYQYNKKQSLEKTDAKSTQTLPSVNYELNILYDHDMAPEFSTKFNHAVDGFQNGMVSLSTTQQSTTTAILQNVRLFPLSLVNFTSYPNVKLGTLSKSHYQHLAHTYWWQENQLRRKWRYVSVNSQVLYVLCCNNI
jgi:hypothetical protein